MSFGLDTLGKVGAGAAAGSAFGPWGTVIGGGIGGIASLFGGGDAPAPVAKPNVVAPTIDPNAGVGSGWGNAYGTTSYGQAPPDLKNLIDQRKAPYENAINDSKAQISALNDQITKLKNVRGATPSGTDAANKLDKQIVDLSAQMKGHEDRIVGANSGLVNANTPTDADTFALEAKRSYDRQAPTLTPETIGTTTLARANVDNANYNEDRGAFNAQGGNLDAQGQAYARQMSMLQNDPSGAGQAALVDRLNSDLAGGQPSLEQAQLNQSTAQNVAQQHAMAASAGPTDYVAAQRAAINAGAQTQQAANMQAATLRAQEYAQARGELGTVLNQSRDATLKNYQLQGDNLKGQTDLYINQRTQQLTAMGMDAQTALAKAQLEAQENSKQAELDQARNLDQAKMNFGAKEDNANLGLSMLGLNQNRESTFLGAYKDSRDAMGRNATNNATMDLTASTANAGNAVNVGIANQGNERANNDTNMRFTGNLIGAGANMYIAGSQANPAPKAPTLGG